MKKFTFLFILIITSFSIFAQIDANSLLGVPTATTVEMNAITTPLPNIGSLLFNTDEQALYEYTATGWQKIGIQTASEVNIDSPVDVDGDSTTEITVEDVIQTISAITSKSARIFYPPSIAIDASTTGTGRTVSLYQEYIDQFAPGAGITTRSTGAPSTIPTYTNTELYYYVTYFDPVVFNNISIDANGVMTYDIIATPPDFNSLINVVFVVK